MIDQYGMSTFVSTQRRISRAVLCSGALPLERIGASRWPDGVPAQRHYPVGDPFRTPGSVESVMSAANAAVATAEYFRYPGAGHLATDADEPGEFDAGATEQM